MAIIIERKNPMKDLEKKIRSYRRREWAKLILTVLTIVSAVVSTYLLLEMQTYSKMKVIERYDDAVTNNGSYRGFSDGVLKYSRDGICLLSKTGQERWNQSYQIKNPVVVMSEKAVAVAEQEGNLIYVFDGNGMKGEIRTTAPVEKFAVADNGIVAAMLRSEESVQVVCYDAVGNILVGHKTTMAGMGYPIGLALSSSGTRLVVTYLTTEGGSVATRVVFYDFSGDVSEDEGYQLSQEIYRGEVVPSVYFATEEKAVLVGESGYWSCRIKNNKVTSEKVEIEKEIMSVFWENQTLGFVLKKAGEEGLEVRLYNLDGKQILSKKIKEEYSNVKLSGGNVILYDGKKACLISGWGVLEFEGEVEQNIMEIVTLTGINKYLVMNADGMEEVRLVK